MKMDTRLLAQAREEIARRRQDNRREQERRREQAERIAPEAMALERELTGLMAQVIGAALQQGGDPAAAVEQIQQRSQALQERQALLLERAGLPRDWLEDIFSCRDCRDTGYILGEPCHCLLEAYADQRQRELARMLRGHSGRFSDFGLTAYDPEVRGFMEQLLAYARAWAENFCPDSENLLLRGGPGLGKTSLCACMFRTVYDTGRTAVLETVTGALRWYEKQKFSRDAGEEAEAWVRRLETCELLALDDLGAEMATSFSHSALYTLLDTRLAEGRKTILVTALDQESLAAQYPPQLVSRLEGEFTALQFYGRDLRRRPEV